MESLAHQKVLFPKFPNPFILIIFAHPNYQIYDYDYSIWIENGQHWATLFIITVTISVQGLNFESLCWYLKYIVMLIW